MRRAVWLAWLLLAAALAPQIARLDNTITLATPQGSASAVAIERLRTDFDGRHDAPLLLVMRGLPSGLSDDSARTVLRGLLAPLTSSGALHTMLSPATSLDTLFWSGDRRSAMALVEYVGDARIALRTLRERSTKVVADARAGRTQPALSSLTMRWTGEPALLADLKDVAARELRRSEWRALPITVLVAWWAFGTVLEALLATGVAALVVVTALGIVGGMSAWWPASPLTASIVSLTGLALSIDYQLIVRRARDSGNSAIEAQRLVRWAALLVTAAFIVLALLPTGEVRSAAFAGAVTASLAALSALARRRDSRTEFDATGPTESNVRSHTPFAARGRWRAWSAQVTRHAWPALLASSALMLWLAWPVTRLRLASPVDKLLPKSAESMQAIDDLATFGRAAVPLTLTVLVDVPRGVSVLDERGWELTRQAVAAIRAMPGVARVDGITTLGNGERIVAQYAIPEEVRNAMMSRTRQSARLTVWTTSSSLDEVQDLAERIRTGVVREVPIAGVMVSGLPVLVHDVSARVRQVIPIVVGGTLLVSFLVLMWRFRAPLIALKAVLVNALVAAAAMGLVVRVFQDSAILSGIFPTVPLLVFAATFGISMDYELILLSAVERETHRNPSGTVTSAVAAAMSDVGGLIWRAAALTGAVCGAFALSALAPLAMIGLALCGAVLLDATIVRLALVPSWLTIAGKWNWWPRRAAGGLSNRRGEGEG